MKLRVRRPRMRRPSRANLLAVAFLASVSCALVGVGRLLGLDVALVVGGIAAATICALADAD